ncbi:MAG: 30S ribosomal protein S16 [Bacteroidia bacterium]
MSTKIRLQRHGKKGNAYFHIVVADVRSPRDGKYIEKLGAYNPNTNPATIEIAFDNALNWLQKGAQPTDTCRAILSYKGVLYKNHLLNGVKKGALTADQVESKFQAWLDEKSNKISSKTDQLATSKKAAAEKALADEKEKNAAKAKAIEAKNAVVVEEVAAAVEETAPVAEEAPAAEESNEEKAAE